MSLCFLRTDLQSLPFPSLVVLILWSEVKLKVVSIWQNAKYIKALVGFTKQMFRNDLK